MYCRNFENKEKHNKKSESHLFNYHVDIIIISILMYFLPFFFNVGFVCV